jgi:hypothetical protein
VSAAVYGSHVFTRFSPCILSDHLTALSGTNIDWEKILNTLDPAITR